MVQPIQAAQKRYRYSLILIKELVKTDFKLRYQGSILGYFWSLLKPLALFSILYVVFVEFLRFGKNLEHFPVYLLLGVVLWTYFTEVTSQSLGSIVGRGELLRKINFPRYTVVLAATLSALINLLLNLVVVFLFMILNHVPLMATALLMPLLILELFIFALGCSLFLSALYVKFRDLSHIWEVLMQGAFYATPILYPLNIVPSNIAKILLLNPMAQIIQDSRWALITHSTLTLSSFTHSIVLRLVPFAIVAGISIGAFLYFRRHSLYFAEQA